MGWPKGKKQSLETRMKRSRALTGIKRSEETRKKISVAKLNSKNPMWKDEVSYTNLHAWIRRNKVLSGKCTHCFRESKTEWAKISEKYTRNLEDYIELCRSCHRKMDKSYLNFPQYAGRR